MNVPVLGPVSFKGNTIILEEYPFAEPHIELPSQKILFVNTSTNPPMLRFGDDVLFISAEYREDLKKFAEEFHVPIRQTGASNWECILSPFLDAELALSYQNHLDDIVKSRGFTAQEIAQIRNYVAIVMREYNLQAGMWDWCSLGLFDVLLAMRASLSKKAFQAFYKEALAIELKGNPALQ